MFIIWHKNILKFWTLEANDTVLKFLVLKRRIHPTSRIHPVLRYVCLSIDTNIISSTSTSTCTYTDIDIEINVWSIDIEINVCIVFLNLLVCLFVCGFTCDIATGHTNEATIMKFGMKDRCVKF